MNSKTIKENHREVYEKFFSNNNLVLSLPMLLNWSGDIFDNYKGIRIKQKLPLRIYIGINKIKDKEIRLKKINYLDISEDKFLSSNILEYAPFFGTYLDFLKDEYKNEVYEKGGIEISFLAEGSRGLGLGFVGIVGFLMMLGLEKIYNKADYLTGNNININDFLNIRTPIDNILRKAIKLNLNVGTRLCLVENCISSFFDGSYPIITFLDDVTQLHPDADINEVNIYGYRLNNLEKDLSSVPFMPIDYGLIYSGRPVLVDHIINQNELSFSWADGLNDKLEKYFGKDLDKTPYFNKPIFYETYVSDKNNVFSDTYGKLMGAISLELLDIMTKVYSTSYNENNIRKFLDVVNKIRHGNYITRKSSKTFTQFLDYLFHNFSSSHRVLGLAPNDTSVMGGVAIFALPLEGLRNDILKSIEKTKESISGVNLLYANWLDGIETRGLIIDQDIKYGVYSEFINKNSVIVDNFNNGKYVCDNFSIEDIDLSGLTLDLINRKIYLDGEKLTSKEIHSQNTTIDILEILLQNNGEDISNGELPKSSYSSNKNEMLGKIIIPLVKLIEDKKKIKFPLICKGSINEFYLKLGDSPIDIRVIRKLS